MLDYMMTVPPDDYPVSVAEAMAHARVDGDAEEDLFAVWIAAATAELQHYTGRQFMLASFVGRMSAFCAGSGSDWRRLTNTGGRIELPRVPFASLTSVGYVDPAGDLQSLSVEGDDPDVIVDVFSDGSASSIRPKPGTVWPATRGEPGDVSIVWQSGVEDADDVPAAAKLAIMALVSHWYTFREPMISGMSVTPVPLTYQKLADSLRIEV